MQNTSNDEAILDRIRTYNPGDTCKRVCLQLFGMPGHGKSSLINTCLCVVHDKGFENVAGSGRSNAPITRVRNDFPLAEKVVITDNRGMSKMSPEELMEIRAQFCHLRGRDRVEWERSLRENLDYILTFLHQNNDVLVPVYVYSAYSCLTPERFQEIEPFIRDVHRVTGINPIIVLTNVQDNNADSETYYKAFEDIGADHIFLIENYTTENSEPNPETRSNVLKFLETCLQEADKNITRNRTTDLQQEYLRNALDVIEIRMQIERDQIERASERRMQANSRGWQEDIELRDREIERLREESNAKDREIKKLRSRRHKLCKVM